MGFKISLNQAQKVAMLGALKSIALADGNITDLENDYIEAFNTNLLNCKLRLDDLDPITPEALANSFSRNTDKQMVLSFCVLLALVNGEAKPAEEKLLKKFKANLGIKSGELDAFSDIRNGKMVQLNKALNRQSFSGYSNRAFLCKHPFSSIRQRLNYRLNIEQPALFIKYRELNGYNDDTLGKCYYNFATANRIRFPGEQGSLPEHLVHHDLTHVLAEFGTTPEEEILTVGFQSAYQNYTPFYSILTAICLFHLGLQGAGAKYVKPEKMKWAPKTFFKEMARGMKCCVDLSGGWNHWEYMDRPICEVRSGLNILPRDRY